MEAGSVPNLAARRPPVLGSIGPPASRAAVLAIGAFLVCAADARASWSVLAADEASGTVVIASAACVPQRGFANLAAKGLMDLQAIVVPGRGIAAAQAAADPSRSQQDLMFNEIAKGTAPSAILDRLSREAGSNYRQYAVVDVLGRTAAFSGAQIRTVSTSRQDEVSGTGIHFVVIGNALASEAVVIAAAEAFKASGGSLTDRAMAAMEAADGKGGDARCSCEAEPRPDGPCVTRTSFVAYILRADPTDRSGDGVNDGHYAMYVSANNDDITPAEDANPVKTLRLRYEAWKRRPRAR